MALPVILIIALGLLSLGAALFYTKRTLSVSVESYIKDSDQVKKLISIHEAIADGAMAFLKQEYKYMAVFIVIFAIIINFLNNDPHTSVNVGFYTAIAFVIGCLVSIASGWIGMRIATLANVRVTASAVGSIEKAFKVALESGAVMGFGLVGLAVLGLISMYLALTTILPDVDAPILMEIIAGFGLGGSSIALFARVGGGIFTKAADIGADLVGKLEQGIPEDDPRNPAVIADNVGDNVGDVAGMGADLFGSCAESTCAALLIGAIAFQHSTEALLYPILITAIGIPISLVTILLVRVKQGSDVAPALKRMLLISSALMGVAIYFLTTLILPEKFSINDIEYSNLGVYWCFLSGLVGGLAIGLLTERYTSHEYKHVKAIAKASETGAATVLIFGLALGYYSATLPILAIAASIFVSFTFAGMYGVAIASLGMLGTLVVALTIDAYGPVADNSGGIAEMAGLGEDIRKKTDLLDAAGNTTAAIGKGFAIGSAILTALALIAAFLTRADQLQPEAKIFENINLLDPLVLTSLFVGAVIPFLFSAMTMKSVGSAAFDMIEEVRRQFRTIPGLLEGTGEPDYKKCIEISTTAALREMILPGVLTMLTPLVIGFLFGIPALAGLLIGTLVSGGAMAISSANAGGAWDNAKKYIESGHHGGKGSDAHAAAVVGDTVGDPFKDTSGPSLNILIKLSAILSLVFVPFFVQYGGILIR